MLDVCQTNLRYWPIAYNICPTDIIDAVIDRSGKRDLVSMREERQRNAGDRQRAGRNSRPK